MHLLPLVFVLAKLLFSTDEAEIIFAGDAMQHKPQLIAAQTEDGRYDFRECFEEIVPLLDQADYAVVNLETPIGLSNFSGYPCFNAPVSYAEALRDTGFDLMLTANNHTLDRLDRGLHSTINLLDSLGIPHVGTYHDAAARDSLIPFIKDIAGFKVGFLNYTYGTNGLKIQGDAVVDYIDKELMAEDIKATRAAGAEIVTVAIHWGDEYQLRENNTQRSLADFLVEQGVDLIIGGHPHVVQPIQVRHNDTTGKNTLVVYSLGNFISNMSTRDTKGGAILKVRLKRDKDGVAHFTDYDYRLVLTCHPDGTHKNYRLVYPYIYDGPWKSQCEEFARTADKVLKTYAPAPKSIGDWLRGLYKELQEVAQSATH